ncbi:histidine triad nucleotide-binding protein [candidate division WOR-1 bacterium RIFOXYD2_FULL_36_8]|uniref:Histidine triad nucleotide-binding protein n=1 Tax=candidate division WOR-1 bacterium RIFOXYB2_FULL_36_35 TaxID=1802578 RepID=A0A1F4S7H7_UNCSA|nr:MAG: histidine triad nucleotide-binding protein [candidate division WOR-1 bacterium RIFOXYA2_FULL_36_21]OGC16037.1 MAG: histidine triad nucleotide-binding protein [candidate division WOR-1 bacterium RIFOXYA12_FULL_36_13]OGC16405.1 MAG: histidine triad nucleotide-binding protein [candidate division WOR-1 bacterium RIFOXYB2_FULL_36_35]OGC39627.1 MAG: histidine triad nucleotide-binding protein [candidate division WOR-1 bacterium RIFOXYD2_FULL_36_8]
MNDCLFCKIINKQIPAEILVENEDVLAFNDINPQAPIHILVIPKTHIASISQVKKEHSQIISKIIKTIQNIAQKTGIIESGFRVVANHGSDAGQAVDHLHFHILGGRKMQWPPG